MIVRFQGKNVQNAQVQGFWIGRPVFSPVALIHSTQQKMCQRLQIRERWSIRIKTTEMVSTVAIYFDNLLPKSNLQYISGSYEQKICGTVSMFRFISENRIKREFYCTYYRWVCMWFSFNMSQIQGISFDQFENDCHWKPIELLIKPSHFKWHSDMAL